MGQLNDYLLQFENLLANFELTKDIIVTSVGVIFGGLITIIINNGAIRKQAFFDLQYNTLSELIEHVTDLEKAIEQLEIAVSFKDKKLESSLSEIKAIEISALKLNEIFREKRSIVHNQLTGIMLEKTAQIPSDFFKIIFETKNSTFPDFKYKNVFDINDIHSLRNLTTFVRKLKNDLTESLEKLIFPGLMHSIIRKIKSLKIFIGNAIGVFVVNKK